MKRFEIGAEDLETIENMIFYYDHHGVENMNKRRPDFVEDDFSKLLAILNTITETI